MVKKFTDVDTMGSYQSGFGITDGSDDFMREKIENLSSGLEYMDEPWRSRLKNVFDDWTAGRITTEQCYEEIKEIEYKQSISIKQTKKMKKSLNISFGDNVSKMRLSNYDKIGNINQKKGE